MKSTNLGTAAFVAGLALCSAVALGGQPPDKGHTHDASEIVSGTLSDERLSPNVTLRGNTFNGPSQLVQLDLAGKLPILDGSSLTSLNAGAISLGILSDARLSPNVTLQGNLFNGPNRLVQLDGTGRLPAVDGGKLTNLDAGAISLGTLSNARLSSVVTLMGNQFNGADQLVKMDPDGKLPALDGSKLKNLPIPPSGIPAGGIIMWSGSIANTPAGWALCDGTNGTPDLRDRFVVGASATKAVGAVGGSATHNHTATTGGASDPRWVDDNSGGDDHWVSGSNHTHAITTNAASNLPPYYALAFIMKTP